MMEMTILRAVRSREMDVDISHRTRIANIERDSPLQVTMYGTEENGQLYYIVLSQSTIDQLKRI